jgi:hypothetical protein
MIDPHNFVYSKAAAARLLGVNVYAIARFEKWKNVYFVQVRGKRPTFIPYSAFKENFVASRIERSKFLYVAPVNDGYFRVVNPKKNTAYSVWLISDGLDCECEDYKNQIAIFKGKGCCKHGYAVLTWLGHGRLSEYIAANEEALAA